MEVAAAFQVHNGPFSSEAKSDICQSDTVARKGTHTRWPLVTVHTSVLGIFERDSAPVERCSHPSRGLVTTAVDSVSHLCHACVRVPGNGSPGGDPPGM